jgi:hypothetical protein
MRDLSVYHRQLEPELEKLDPQDPRFLHVADLAQGARYTEAADAVEALLGERLYEVRLLGYHLFAVFHEEGLSRLPAVLEALAALIQRNWQGLAPADKQVMLLNKGVTWFLQQAADALAYHRARKSELWSEWLRTLAPEQADASLRQTEALQGLLSGPAFRTGFAQLARLTQELLEVRSLLTAARAAPAPQGEQPAGTPAPATAAPAPLPTGNSPFLLLGQLVQLRGSAHFVDLCNKLKAFELLIQRRQYEKAALVSDDILATLEGFDPRKYFPELFATFGALLSQHVENIQPYWERKESVEWKTLTQFFQVDLESFVGRE